jgi:hypothetical protein
MFKGKPCLLNSSLRFVKAKYLFAGAATHANTPGMATASGAIARLGLIT